MVASLVIGGGALAGGALGFLGTTSAANTQATAEQQALQFQQQQALKAQPFINAGTSAVSGLTALFGPGADYSGFYNSPDYQFAQQQGNLGLQRYENSQGLGLSGGALKDIASFNSGLATQNYGNYFNRLMQLSQLGSNAATNNASNSIGIGNTIGAIGQSQAGGILGGTNAIVGGINSAVSNSLLAGAINRSSYAPPNQYALQGPATPSFLSEG